VKTERWSEDALLSAASSGSTDAFGELAGRYRGALSQFARRYARDPDEAGDIAQETFLRAFQHLGSYHRDRPFRPWLLAIARNAAYDVLRYRKRTIASGTLDEEVESRVPGPEESTLRRADVRSVRGALATLPGRYRRPIELYYLAGLRYREIADVLDLPIGTVKTHIARAKRRLRLALEDDALERTA
jgi:RNA polymerase sigma-70 factor (ECF subfamily)